MRSERLMSRRFAESWRGRRAARVTDEFALGYHRLVARRLRRDPSLIGRAAHMVGDAVRHPDLRERWRTLLAEAPAEVHRVITSRSQTAYHMRIESPFRMMGLVTADERLRLLGIAKCLAERYEPTPTSSMPSAR